MNEGYRRQMAERGRPLFSIGAVARMLDLSAATIRTWETRDGLITPQRAGGGTRLRVLLAESRLGAARVLQELLGSEGFEVLVAADPNEASRAYDELAP